MSTPPTSHARLELSHVTKAFGATQALADVSLQVAAGEAHALIGENGAGKSTLLKILAGVHRADTGNIRLQGIPYQPRNPLEARRNGVAMIHQELTLAPHLSVEENLTLGLEPRNRLGLLDHRRRREMALATLARLGTDLPLNVPASALTVAQQQLIEIARALLTEPQLLILDEPTSSLTRADTQRLFTALERLRTSGVSLLYVSHFLEECRQVCSHFTVLRDGRSVAHGTLTDTPSRDVIRHMVGREVHELYPRSPRQPGEVMLDVSNFSGHTKPIAASFKVHAGEVLGLFGLVGAGRTETLRALFGLDPVTGGEVTVVGDRKTVRPPHRRLRDGIALLSEDRKREGLLLGRSLRENLTLTRPQAVSRWGILSHPTERASTREWMERLEVKARDEDQPVGELSGGNQQKIAFGRLLFHEARILLLDEPTRGIDVGAKVAIYQRIDRAASRGQAVILVSSYLPELLGICDTIAAFNRGRVAEIRPVADWSEDSLLAAAVGT